MNECRPADAPHVTYTHEYRRCGKPQCSVCADGGRGHGPYWYAYWREDGRVRSRYVGKQPPSDGATALVLQVTVLGGLAARRGVMQVPADFWLRRRQLTAVFVHLLLAPGHQIAQETLTESLWGATTPATAAARLRSAVRALNQALALGVPGAHRAIRLRGGQLQLAPSGDGVAAAEWYDVPVFMREATAALKSDDLARCRAALARYTGPFLAELSDARVACLPSDLCELVDARRAMLDQLYCDLLKHLARHTGDAAEAMDALRRGLALDPCDERMAEALMQRYIHAGRHVEAARLYDRVAAELRARLDVAPGARIRRVRESLSAAAGDRWPMPGRRTNLPRATAELIGRRALLTEVCAALRPSATDGAPAAPRSRLITLTGTGGVGKTRLALEVARALLDAYAGGVWLVELAPVQDPGQVAAAIGGALGVIETPTTPMLDALVAWLRDRQLLLLLDNCEHVLGACREVVENVARHCPGVRLLATSREALGLDGELVRAVEPLALPTTQGGRTGTLASEAALLFVARARPYLSEAAIDADEIAAICRVMGGLPLGIELAAAQCANMSLPQLRAHLQHQLLRLASDDPAGEQRHRTMRAAIAWSYALLSRAERALLRRLTVFAGGWTLEAAIAVSATADADPDRVRDLLQALVARSIVRRQACAGVCWYSMLEPIRAFAAEHLMPATAATARGAHQRFFLALAERAAAERGTTSRTWLARLDLEHDNLRAALAWRETAAGRDLPRLQLAIALHWFWAARGHLSEGRRWLDQLRVEVRAVPPLIRAYADSAAGDLAYRQGAYEDAERLQRACVAIFRRHGDATGIAAALAGLGNVATYRGDLAQARGLHDACLALRRELGDRRGIVSALDNLAEVALLQHDLAEAAARYAECLDLARALHDVVREGSVLNGMAYVALWQGDHERAAHCFAHSVAMQQRAGDLFGLTFNLEGLGELAIASEAYSRAAYLLGALEMLRATAHVPLQPIFAERHQQTLATLTAHLAPEAFWRAWSSGATAPLDDVLATVTGSARSEAPAPRATSAWSGAASAC